jgi:hypothetical protein
MKVWEYIRSSRRNTALAALAGVVVVVGVLWLTGVGPFAPSLEERVSDEVGSPARCRTFGLLDIGKVYRCTYRTPDGYASRCFVMSDGDVFDATSRMNGC